MQRIGHMRALLGIAEPTRRRSLDDLARLLYAEVSRRVPPSDGDSSDQLREWLQRRQQAGAYPQDISTLQTFQLQHLWLSKPDIPSYTGTITPQTSIEIVRWALACGLLRENTNVLSPTGLLLRRIDAETAGRVSEYPASKNPYTFEDIGSRTAWALVVLAADAAVVQLLFSKFPREQRFNRTEAGNLLPECYTEISSSLVRPSDRALSESLQRGIRALQEQEERGGRGLREHHVAVRLEPLVDLGLLTKPDPYLWEYVAPASNLEFEALELPAGDEEWPRISAMAEIWGLDAAKVEDDLEAWSFLWGAFELVKSPVNYAGLKQVLIGATALAARSGALLDPGFSLDILGRMQVRHPKLVRINVDRFGRLSNIRIPRELTEDS